MIVNLDGYHSYRDKIEKENLEVVLIPILTVPILAFVTSSCCIDLSLCTVLFFLSFVVVFLLKYILSDKSIATPGFLISICPEYGFPSPHFQFAHPLPHSSTW